MEMRRRFCGAALLAVGGALLLAGCHRAASTSPSAASGAAPSPSPRLVSDLPVQRSAAYREAERRYARKDYRGALARVTQLLSDPARTPAEQAFLQRQRALCEQALIPRLPLQRNGTAAVPYSGRERGAQPRPTPSEADCGPKALLLVCRQLGVTGRLEELRRAAGTTERGTTLEGLAKAARAKGLQAEGVQMDRQALANLSQPALAWVDGDHYLAVLAVEGEQARVHDPNRPHEEGMPVDELLRRSGGVLLILSR